MPNLQAQFRGNAHPLLSRLNDLDNANIILARDMEKLATGEIHPEDVRKYAEDSLKAAYLIVGPR